MSDMTLTRREIIPFTKSFFLLLMWLSAVSTRVLAYDIAAENSDGVTIYYTYSSDGKELEVTNGSNKYSGDIVIPKEITYMTRTRPVSTIGKEAFFECTDLLSVAIPESVNKIDYRAFYGCTGLTSVTVPKSVTIIGLSAFANCKSLSSVTLSDGVTNIGVEMFKGCSHLTYVSIPNSVTLIGMNAFEGCSGLNSISIPSSITLIHDSAFVGCTGLTSVNITDLKAWYNINFDNSDSNPLCYGHHLYMDGKEITQLEISSDVTVIKPFVFFNARGLTFVKMSNDLREIGNGAFQGCTGLTSITIPPNVARIGASSFRGCTGLTSITIPESVESIGSNAFNEIDLTSVHSQIKYPSGIYGKSFSSHQVFTTNTFNNATLYIPEGTIENYKATNGWQDFVFIEPDEGHAPVVKECAVPAISYTNGKLTFHCETEGVTYRSTITDSDISSYYSNEVQLNATYLISVYATKDGYRNSKTVTATLCWIEKEPKTIGIENRVANISTQALLIQSESRQITVLGAEDGDSITAYTLDGKLLGSTVCRNGQANLPLGTTQTEIVIIKVGEKAVKVRVR